MDPSSSSKDLNCAVIGAGRIRGNAHTQISIQSAIHVAQTLIV